MPVNIILSEPTVLTKQATSAPQNALSGISPLRRVSHSDRHLSMTDPEIHKAILRSFHLSRRIDRQASLPVVPVEGEYKIFIFIDFHKGAR